MTPDVDTVWLLICVALVMLMQAGFLCLETGLTRSKNNINVAVKNLTDFGVSVLLFWLVGYGLMFGSSAGGWIGISGFAQDLSSGRIDSGVFFLFQALFCGAAVTIMSGAVAERLRFGWYFCIAIVISLLIYPIVGHWAWNDSGWLAELGFIDFAGSTVVHSVGGWAGLAVVLVLGPRLGRFDGGEVKQLSGSNMPFATLGALLLWTGWVGFNGGSLFTFDERVVGVVANTAVGGAAGLVVALGMGWRRSGLPRVTDPINGLLGGLVAVTASADMMSTAGAVLIGAGGAICMSSMERLLERRRIDDAVGAVPVHLGAGIFGTVAAAFVADGDRSLVAQLGIQILGVVVTGAVVFGSVWSVCRALNEWWPLRVTVADEETGLNVAEHGASTDLMDLFVTMEAQAASGDLTLRVPEGSFSEAGQIGRHYNRVIEALDSSRDELDTSEKAANTDQLTKTLNRRGLSTTLEAFAHEEMTVLMFDVVRFGSINGTLGYTTGDRVLTEIAHHVGRRLGSAWWFGRWGGDEFVAITPKHIEIDEDTVASVACGLGGGGQVTVSLRAGALHADGRTVPEEIMRQVSFALDESKLSGSQLVSFKGDLARRYQKSADLAATLGGSLSAMRIVPVAQTIVTADRIVGAELLARWMNDDGSLAPPVEFLPVLIEHGLMYELDLHMLERGIAFASRFNDIPDPPWVSVNVSAPNVGAQGFIAHVELSLERYNVSPERLVIEITEAEQVHETAHWLANAHKLRDLGVGLAVDDFGSGYSGLERMNLVPLTHIKFDRELTQSAAGPMGSVMKSVVDYTRETGVVPVAEGIETSDQEQAIAALGIDAMQGFWFSRPERLDDVEKAIVMNKVTRSTAGS